jgi:beta-1,4-N-acetylglucosaminyltransferase
VSGVDAAAEPMIPRKRFLLVGSSGGHLTQMLAMREIWEESDRAWVTFRKSDAVSVLADERCHWCHYPTNRHIGNLVRNFGLALRVLWRERPDVVISTGAGAAIPYFLLGRAFGAVLVYVEVYDRIDSPTITGRIAARASHVFALQWPEQQRHYPRGTYIGPLL